MTCIRETSSRQCRTPYAAVISAVALLVAAASIAAAQEKTDAQLPSYRPFVEAHLRQLTTSGLDVYGPQKTGMWMAIIDTRTGRYPEFEHTPKRVYRKIGAPRGSSLYWDQASVIAANQLSELTGDPAYRQAAERYIADFLAACVDDAGMFRWGNHCYYDAFEDKLAPFSGGYHELRPHAPAWELFWRQDAQLCEKYIRVMTARHLYDPASGGFNRHDNQKREHAFLEAGGVLVESLAWLYGKTHDRSLLDRALQIARYSHSHRGKSTGLVINDPDGGRWDSLVCTTEVAAWANSLLRAADFTGEEEFTRMAEDAVSAYLKYGYDDAAGLYFGQLRVDSGKPVTPQKQGYWPRRYSLVWNPDQWPTHDYPMAMANACVTLFQTTGKPIYREGIERWVEVVRREARQTAYAGQYGQCIDFLTEAAVALEKPELRQQAHELARESIDRLCENGWFQGYPEAHLYESVDGVGDLLLALIRLETTEREKSR